MLGDVLKRNLNKLRYASLKKLEKMRFGYF